MTATVPRESLTNDTFEDRRALNGGAPVDRSSHDTGERSAAPLRRDGAHAAPESQVHEIRRVVLRSAAKWAVALALTTLVAWYAAIALLWGLASAFDGTHRLEQLVRDLGFEGFRLASDPVFLALALVGMAWVLGVLGVTLLAATAFNFLSAVLGGLHVVVATPESADEDRWSD